MMVGLLQKGSSKEVTLRQKTLRLLRYKLRKIRKDAKWIIIDRLNLGTFKIVISSLKMKGEWFAYEP